ncbi:MAG TPA: serine hydrolase [Polyangiaceae bacterium]|nr:serine hydrolase [Polyangiaceae bacterium]
MNASPSPTRNATLRRAVALAGGAVLALAVAAGRPWSSRNSLRQMRLFAPGSRIENFREMDAIFPAKTLTHARVPHRFQTVLRPLPASFRFGGKDVPVTDFLDRTVTTGLLVLRGETILTEQYFRGAREDSPLTSWSVAKSVVSLLIGIAKAEGKFPDLGTKLETLVPEFRGSAYGAVPVRDALTMSSGIDFSEEYDDPTSDIHTMFARLLYFRESAVHYLGTRKALRPPGDAFHYASSDTFALGLALRHAVGKSLAEYLQEKLWTPLGMEYDATWNAESDDGAELAFCCLNVRLRDYAKIGRLAARFGDWDGQRIVPEEWIRESTRVEPARAPGTLPKHPWGYEYQWWIPASGAFMAAGVWGQFIFVDPAKEFVIVKTSVDPRFMENADETIAFFEALRKADAD